MQLMASSRCVVILIRCCNSSGGSCVESRVLPSMCSRHLAASGQTDRAVTKRAMLDGDAQSLSA